MISLSRDQLIHLMYGTAHEVRIAHQLSKGIKVKDTIFPRDNKLRDILNGKEKNPHNINYLMLKEIFMELCREYESRFPNDDIEEEAGELSATFDILIEEAINNSY